jgi:hypothetical protein
MSCTGAVWLDADQDGRRLSAHDYAVRCLAEAKGDFSKLLTALADYDRAVAIQAAHLWQSSGESLLSESAQATLKQASTETQAGFQEYLNAWRENQLARAGK